MAEYFYQKPTDDEVAYWSQVVKPKKSIFELNFRKAVTIGSIVEWKDDIHR